MRRRGFTLVELLVVILIIGLLASIVVPVLIHVLNVAKQGLTETTMSQVGTAIANYELTTMKYPPGDGHGSRELVTCLRGLGPKKMPWVEIQDDQLSPEGDLLNVLHRDDDPPINVIHYRNNRGRKPGPDGVGRPGVSATRAYDLWGAGMDYDAKRPDSAWTLQRP